MDLNSFCPPLFMVCNITGPVSLCEWHILLHETPTQRVVELIDDDGCVYIQVCCDSGIWFFTKYRGDSIKNFLEFSKKKKNSLSLSCKCMFYYATNPIIMHAYILEGGVTSKYTIRSDMHSYIQITYNSHFFYKHTSLLISIALN